jgi:hypothetical protein
MNYISLFKNRIKKEVTSEMTIEGVSLLFESIKSDISHAGNLVGLPNVDEITLKSYFETAKKEYLSVNTIDPGISHSLTKDGFVSWLSKSREDDISWDYTERYFKHLLKTGRSQNVVDETRRSSREIIKKISDPKSRSSIYTKGLVVGAVQSGKTGNFNAVINRSIDSGYGLIIVLSGIMEDLRSQTQKRIESDVIGEGRDLDTNTIGKKGAGEIERFGKLGNSPVNQVKSITSTKSDFNRALLDNDFSLNDVNVLVCKKNVSVLRNLIVWLHDCLDKNKERHNIPLLILDDEADNASLNNLGAKGRDYASKTNSQIRALLGLFNIKTYLGYTATPFANVLQDRNTVSDKKYIEKYKFEGEQFEKELSRVDNIFPDDFIELLEPPSNYVGAKQIFETIIPIQNMTDDNEKIPLLAPAVSDYRDDFPSRVYKEDPNTGVENITKDEWDDRFGYTGHLNFDTWAEYRVNTRASKKDDLFPKKLPESLKDAIKCFVLALAIRESRIPSMEKSKLFQPHNTMLVHISRFTFWQNKTKELIVVYVNDLISKIENDNPSRPNSIYEELKKLWYSKYGYAHIVENIKDYLPTGYDDEFMVPIVFDAIKYMLPNAVKGIEIKAINSLTKEKLEYPKGSPKKIIAIGGNRLSRGFTLEGLTINYFIRTTNYSDGLLQMGRWFGYRPGYLDCCKIFTTQDSLDKFDSTTKCIEELETEFKKMEEQDKDPKSFVLRVRKHPGTLKITRPSILKNAKNVNWSYADQLEMTTTFNVTNEHIKNTWSNFKKNIAPRFNSKKRGLLTYKTSGEGIIEILNKQSNNFTKVNGSQIVKFIELCNDKGMLTDWTVALKITSNAKEIIPPKNLGIIYEDVDDIRLAQRSGPKVSEITSIIENNIFKASGKNANIIAANTDLAITLTDEEITIANDSFYSHKTKEIQKKNPTFSEADALAQARKSKTIPERYYRQKMKETQGVLIIYLLDTNYVFHKKGKKSEDPETKHIFDDYLYEQKIDLNIPLVGYALGFPPIEKDPGGEYMQGDYDLNLDEGDNEDDENDDEIEAIIDINEA